MANRLDRVRLRQFILERVNRTNLKSVGERQRKYLSVMRPNKRATHELYVVLKTTRRNKRATQKSEIYVVLKAMRM